jgi:hypothetical protein
LRFDEFPTVAPNARQTLIEIVPVNSAPTVERPSEQNVKTAEPLKSADKRKIDELLSPLGMGTGIDFQKTSDGLVEFVKNDPARRSYAAGKLISEIKQACEANEKYIHYSDFARVQFASNTLAELEVIEALDTLIDCSNRRSPVGGLSPHNWATVPAIIKYREKAMPALIEKMGSQEVGRDVKEQIYIMWREITEQIKKDRNN